MFARRPLLAPKRVFQCSSASRKFLNGLSSTSSIGNQACFSALQRAENSSISRRTQTPEPHLTDVSVLFSEPKIPQSALTVVTPAPGAGFQCSSASRKFLNHALVGHLQCAVAFQCSSASRKFLNRRSVVLCLRRARGFSALQRAENSSMRGVVGEDVERNRFQCSSASRKFLNRMRYSYPARKRIVSVLFSEPKIPQWR